MQNDSYGYRSSLGSMADIHSNPPTLVKLPSFQEQLASAMNAAKQAHSCLPADVINNKDHSWEQWYAKYMITFYPHLFKLR